MIKFKTFIKYSCIFISTFILMHCATQSPPSGGPVDRTAPTITYTFPAKDSLRVSSDLQKINILFSERMEPSSLIRNLYFSPPLDYEIDWQSWDEVDILLNEKLLGDQTYVISLTTGLKDLQNNGLAQSYMFAFSTGDKLDQNSIAGQIFGLEKNASVYLFAYQLTEGNLFAPDTTKPLYISKSGDEGKFDLKYLKDGKYRVLAVDDQNQNLLLDANLESVGIPDRDVYLDSLRSNFKGLNFRLSKVDTTAPKLVSVRPVYDKTLQVRFSEIVPLEVAKQMVLTDSVNGDTIHVIDMNFDEEYKNIVTVFTEQMDSTATYKLNITELRDSLLNKADSIPQLYFHPVTKIDTTTFKLIQHEPKDSSSNLHPLTGLSLRFNRPIDKKSLQAAHSLVRENGEQVSGSWRLPNQKTAYFIPDLPLDPDSSYSSNLNMKLVTDIWGFVLADSIDSHYFSIVSSREFGSISGTIQLSQFTQKPVTLFVEALRKNIKKMSLKLKGSTKFRFNDLPEGNYTLNGFLDENEDGAYSAGTLFPFSYSEPFTYSTDTIKVRKRWETENIRFNLPIPERKDEPADTLR